MVVSLSRSSRLLTVYTADATCGMLVYGVVGDLWLLPSLLASCDVLLVLVCLVLVLLTTTFCLYRVRELTRACLDDRTSLGPNNRVTGWKDPEGSEWRNSEGPGRKHHEEAEWTELEEPGWKDPKRLKWRDAEALTATQGDPKDHGFISQWLSRSVRDADTLLKTSVATNCGLGALAMTVCLRRLPPADLHSEEEDCWYSDSNYAGSLSSMSQIMLLQLLLTMAPTLTLVALKACLRKEAKKAPQGQQWGTRISHSQWEGSSSYSPDTSRASSLGGSAGSHSLPLGRCFGPVGDVAWLSLLVGVHLPWLLCGCGVLALYWRVVVLSGVLIAIKLLFLPLLALRILGTGAG